MTNLVFDKPCVVTVHNAAGSGNIGEECLLLGAVESLRKQLPHGRLRVVCVSEDLTLSRNLFDEVVVTRNSSWLAAVRRLWWLRETNIYLLGGGGLFGGWNTRILLGLIVRGAWLKLMNKPVMIFSIGADPFHSRISRMLLRIVGALVDQITVRDEFSRQCFVDGGIHTTPIQVTADLAFCMPPGNQCLGATLLDKFGVPQQKRLISVHTTHSLSSQFISQIGLALDQILNLHEDVRLVFIPFENPQDVMEMRKIIEIMDNRDRCYLLPGRSSPHEVASILCNVQMVISMRYHPLVLACANGIPGLALAFSNKVRSLYEELDLTEFIVHCGAPKDPSQNIDPKEVVRVFQNLWQQLDSLPIALQRKSEPICERAWNSAKLVADLLDSQIVL
jgi:polysaccharide pyruvyl transferase WcaK-like protein